MEKARFAFDVLLIVLYVAPATLLFLLSLSCGGWNEGTGSGTCSVAVLEPLYVNLYTIFFVLSLSLIGVAYMIALLAIFVGSFGFRLMSLSEGLAAVKKDWFGFLVVGLSILIFFMSLL
jgi:hypothetical protein